LVLGVSVALIAIPAQTSLQDRAPSELRGRVFALLYTMTSLIVIVPLIFLGALADRIGIPSVSLLIAVSGLGVAAFCALRGRAIANIHASEPTS
jgi:MFS family permease